MAVTNGFRTFILEILSHRTPVRARSMFGGVGLYADDRFFGLIDDDVLYFKVDDATRPRYVERGAGPFRPYGPDGGSMEGYYEVPGELLDDPDALEPWFREALEVAERTGARKAARRR